MHGRKNISSLTLQMCSKCILARYKWHPTNNAFSPKLQVLLKLRLTQLQWNERGNTSILKIQIRRNLDLSRVEWHGRWNVSGAKLQRCAKFSLTDMKLRRTLNIFVLNFRSFHNWVSHTYNDMWKKIRRLFNCIENKYWVQNNYNNIGDRIHSF